jgi:hypothetical protein
MVEFPEWRSLTFANSRIPARSPKKTIHKWDQRFESAFLLERVCKARFRSRNANCIGQFVKRTHYDMHLRLAPRRDAHTAPSIRTGFLCRGPWRCSDPSSMGNGVEGLSSARGGRFLAVQISSDDCEILAGAIR